ncbi:MAG: hypothetical protein WC250_01255 [Candidatus Paceibacterota bacterium]|jgi:hypothetical protein
MNSQEKYVPPEKGKGLFDLMRKVVDGKVEAEEVIDEAGTVASKIITKSESAKTQPKNFQTAAGAMDEWQKAQEEAEERSFEQRKRAA